MESVKTIITLLGDLTTFLWLILRPQCAFAVENLFLRKQLRHVSGNVTSNPTAAWTLQQLREAIPTDHGYRFLIHDRDGIFSPRLDRSISHRGFRVLRSPPGSPKASSPCERIIGTLRPECLDFFIPITEIDLRSITTKWMTQYKRPTSLQYRPRHTGTSFRSPCCATPTSTSHSKALQGGGPSYPGWITS